MRWHPCDRHQSRLCVTAWRVWFVYVKDQPASLGDGVHTVEQRVANLDKLHVRENKMATEYGWVDKDKGIVRLPISRAVELTIEDLKSAK